MIELTTDLDRMARWVLARPIAELELTRRAEGLLKRAGVHTVHDLVLRTPADILAIQNMGRRSLGVIRQALGERGLTLAPVPRVTPEEVTVEEVTVEEVPVEEVPVEEVPVEAAEPPAATSAGEASPPGSSRWLVPKDNSVHRTKAKANAWRARVEEVHRGGPVARVYRDSWDDLVSEVLEPPQVHWGRTFTHINRIER